VDVFFDAILLAHVPHKVVEMSQPGVDVMITIFCDFRQFLAKILAFFSKTYVAINFLHNLALF
jgi:hypothetical protein